MFQFNKMAQEVIIAYYLGTKVWTLLESKPHSDGLVTFEEKPLGTYEVSRTY